MRSARLLAERGEPVTVLPFAVGHVCGEASFAELWRHEVRWALTIRSIDPLGYVGWSITHAFAAGPDRAGSWAAAGRPLRSPWPRWPAAAS